MGRCADCGEYTELKAIITFHGVYRAVCEICLKKYSERMTEIKDQGTR
jgi:hypothetical protein